MNYRKKATSVLLLAVMVVTALYAGSMGSFTQEEFKELVAGPTETLHIWYHDESMTEYLTSAAIAYKDKTGIRVVPVISTGAQYLETINQVSLFDQDRPEKAADPDEIPDLYLVRNDSLEKAYLGGLAIEAKDAKAILNTGKFPQTALDAVTYQGKIIGYPLSYETSVFLYNRTYLEEMAKNQLLAESGQESAEAEGTTEAEDNTEVNTEEPSAFTEEEITARVNEMIPETIDDILIFADQFDAPEAVEAVLKWDVSDIFYNYFIIGNYMSVGGPTGDDQNQISIYNQETIKSLRVYQDLNQFFSIDTKEVTYDSVLSDFMDGKIVYSVVTTDAIAKLEGAKQEGTCDFDYGIARIPAINDEMKTRSLSVTTAVVVNGYSERQEEAEAFAAFLTDDYVTQLYSKSNKPAARLDVVYENEKVNIAMEEYRNSVPMPKMLASSNFWVWLEICFTNAWLGEDVNSLLMDLSEKIMTQVTGEEYIETYIEEEEIVQDVIVDEGMEE